MGVHTDYHGVHLCTCRVGPAWAGVPPRYLILRRQARPLSHARGCACLALLGDSLISVPLRLAQLPDPSYRIGRLSASSFLAPPGFPSRTTGQDYHLGSLRGLPPCAAAAPCSLLSECVFDRALARGPVVASLSAHATSAVQDKSLWPPAQRLKKSAPGACFPTAPGQSSSPFDLPLTRLRRPLPAGAARHPAIPPAPPPSLLPVFACLPTSPATGTAAWHHEL